MDTLQRYTGSLCGLAAGDALGTTLEFRAPGTFEPLPDMIGGGPFHLKPGEQTNDTSMALCLAESLIACEGNNPTDQLERYTRWYREGHLSSTGRCFNIGHTVRKALSIFEQSRDPYSGPSDTRSAGNGSIMRLAPVHLFYARRPLDAIRHSGESSRTTHGNRAAVDACRYFGGLLAGVVNGQLAGACYGIGDIPERWLERLALRPLIERFAEKIYRLNRKSTCEKRIVRG